MLKYTLIFAAIAGLVLALAPAAAMADATWTGAVNDLWSNMGNWSGDPTAGGWFTLPAGTTSTVDTDTSSWTNYGYVMADDTVTLNVIAGGLLRSPSAENQPNGGTLRQTGGEVNIGNRIKGDAGLTEISGGTFWNTRYTYCDVARMHIIGSDPVSVGLDSWITYGPPSPIGYLDFTLDANGVTPLTWRVYGSGRTPVTTIAVDGIAAYLAGAGNVGDIIPLFYDDNSVLDHPTTFLGVGLVDGGLGEVKMNVAGTGFDVEILPEPATMALLAFGGLGLLLRRKRR